MEEMSRIYSLWEYSLVSPQGDAKPDSKGIKNPHWAELPVTWRKIAQNEHQRWEGLQMSSQLCTIFLLNFSKH